MGKLCGNKIVAEVIISCVALVMLAGAAVAAVGYLNDSNNHNDSGKYGPCENGEYRGSNEGHCSGEGNCTSGEQCEQDGDCRYEGTNGEKDHDCYEENQCRGEGGSQTGNGHGCHR